MLATTGPQLDPDTWDLVRSVADEIAGDLEPVTNGIWELREPLDLVDADIGRWLALDVALWIARLRHPLTRRAHWRGNTPLVWSHMEAARAMYVLDAARIRHRRGGLWLTACRLTRYVQLRWFTGSKAEVRERR